MTNYQGDEWKRNLPDAPEPPLTRVQAQTKIDLDFGQGRITRCQWNRGFDNLSNLMCDDYRKAISTEATRPLGLTLI